MCAYKQRTAENGVVDACAKRDPAAFGQYGPDDDGNVCWIRPAETERFLAVRNIGESKATSPGKLFDASKSLRPIPRAKCKGLVIDFVRGDQTRLNSQERACSPINRFGTASEESLKAIRGDDWKCRRKRRSWFFFLPISTALIRSDEYDVLSVIHWRISRTVYTPDGGTHGASRPDGFVPPPPCSTASRQRSIDAITTRPSLRGVVRETRSGRRRFKPARRPAGNTVSRNA